MARINLNQPKVIATAHRQAGPHVRKTANLIVQASRRLAPRGNHMSGSGARKPGLQLQQSLHVRSHSTPYTITERVGSDKDYAATAHQGSSPHRISGRGKQLKFEWERGTLLVSARRTGRLRGRGRSAALRPRGRFFFFASVSHPGNKRPVRYLTTPMHLYGRLNGFRTSSRPVSHARLP